MSKVLRFGGVLAATLVLLAPALWNRFPLIQYDTGGYLARWYEGYLVPSRSTVYGLFLTVLQHPDFWLVVVVQAALTVWMLALLLRVFGFGERLSLLFAVTLSLSVFTTLPWLTSILLTDIFAGLSVLALHLLVFCDDKLRRFERGGLIALIAFGAATHSATFAVLIALLAAMALAWRVLKAGAAAGLVRGTAAIALGAALLVGANYAVAGRVAWTPGGVALAFGRMLQDGIVARYLAEHCPDRRFRLCNHRHELPDDADVYFWGESVFDQLGRFKGLDPEMRTIVFESLAAYPAWQAEAAVVAFGRQLVRNATGEGVVPSAWHTQGMIAEHTPAAVPSMRAARQQRGELDFSAINRIHEPVALAAMVLLAALAFAGRRREGLSDFGWLAATATTALIANAAVCGILSNPHDRYGARLVWIAPLVVGLAALRLYRQRQRAALPVSKALQFPPHTG